MNTKQKQSIASLSDDAPAAAVLAAWAGKEVYPGGGMWWVEGLPIDERTLRRWLLDSEIIRITEDKPGPLYYAEIEYRIDPEQPLYFDATADSPEAAFTAAYEQFASALREEAKS